MERRAQVTGSASQPPRGASNASEDRRRLYILRDKNAYGRPEGAGVRKQKENKSRAIAGNCQKIDAVSAVRT